MDQLPRLEKRELICLLLFTRNYVVSVLRGFLFLWVLGMGYVILLWHSLSLQYNYFSYFPFRFRGHNFGSAFATSLSALIFYLTLFKHRSQLLLCSQIVGYFFANGPLTLHCSCGVVPFSLFSNILTELGFLSLLSF